MKRFNLIIAILVVWVLSNCTNLDENLKDTWTNSNFLHTPTEIAAAIAAPYQTLYSYGGNDGYFDLQELTTDEMMIPQRGGDWYDGGIHVQLHTHTYNSVNQVMGVWSTIFGGISACNRLLSTPAISSGTTPAALSAIAELHCLRAYFYWQLMDLYGNVPLVTELSQEVGQSTSSQVYSFIEGELTQYGPQLPKAINYGRLTRYGAYAVLAKMYLNAQVYTGTAQWAKCLSYCDSIMNSGLYGLEPQFQSVFDQTNNGSKEHIFVIPFDQVYGQNFNMDAMTLHYSSQLTYNSTFQPWNGYCSLEDFYNSYDNADIRKSESFLEGIQYAADGVTPIQDASYEAVNPNPNDPNAMADPDGPTVNFTPFVNELAPNCLRQAGVRVGKFTFYLGMSQNLNNDFPIYRYGDVLLTAAEARFNSTGNWADPTGLKWMNMVHERAGLPDYTVMTPTELIAERGREMFSEAWRRVDLIRAQTVYGLPGYAAPWFGKEADTDNHWALFPIPIQQITATAGTAGQLNQNPGYQ